MQPTRALRARSSVLARVGIAAVVGAVLVAIPAGHARAADDHSAARTIDDAPVTALADRLAESQRDAHARLRALMQTAIERTSQRVLEARRRMDLVVQWSEGLDALASPSKPSGRPQRLEVVTDTHDPLAGL